MCDHDGLPRLCPLLLLQRTFLPFFLQKLPHCVRASAATAWSMKYSRTWTQWALCSVDSPWYRRTHCDPVKNWAIVERPHNVMQNKFTVTVSIEVPLYHYYTKKTAAVFFLYPCLGLSIFYKRERVDECKEGEEEKKNVSRVATMQKVEEEGLFLFHLVSDNQFAIYSSRRRALLTTFSSPPPPLPSPLFFLHSFGVCNQRIIVRVSRFGISQEMSLSCYL